MEFARTFLKIVSKAERTITLLAFAVMTLVIIADVFSRKLTGVGIAGAPRIGVFAMIATAFVSFGLASDARRHLRPKFADTWFPEHWDGAITRIQELLTAAFCLVFAIVAVGVVRETYELGEATAHASHPRMADAGNHPAGVLCRCYPSQYFWPDPGA